jgi:hypothetical protein
LTRTPEEAAVDADLEKAIQHLIEVYDFGKGLLGDYLVIAVTHDYDDSGAPCTNVNMIEGGEHGVPEYRALGMLEVAREYYRPVPYDLGQPD